MWSHDWPKKSVTFQPLKKLLDPQIYTSRKILCCPKKWFRGGHEGKWPRGFWGAEAKASQGSAALLGGGASAGPAGGAALRLWTNN